MDYGIEVSPKFTKMNDGIYCDMSEYNKYIRDGDKIEIWDYDLEDLQDKKFRLCYKVEISEQDYDSYGNSEYIIEHDRTEYLYSFKNENEVLDEANCTVSDIKFATSHEIKNDTKINYNLQLALLMEDKDFGFIDLTHHSDMVIEPKIFYQISSIVTDFDDFIEDSRKVFGEVWLDDITLEYAIKDGYLDDLTYEEIEDCVRSLNNVCVEDIDGYDKLIEKYPQLDDSSTKILR